MAQSYDPYEYEDEDDPLNGKPWQNANNVPGATNNQNAPPDLYHEPAGNTGGWIDGIGQTIAPGSSITPAQRDSYTQGALGQGISQGWIDAYIARNPNDFNRLEEAYFSDDNYEDFRTKSPNVTDGAGESASVYTHSGGGGNSGGGAGNGGAQASAADSALAAYLSTLQTRDAEAKAQQDQMRKILMEQLTLDQQPISADSPGIREVLAGSRLGLQRGAERQRQGAAELRAYDGSGGLGGKAFESDVNRIEQQQAESDSMMTGEVLNRELQQKQQRLTQRLALAMQLGDAESARLIQSQLQAIQTQLSQGNFKDTLGYNYTALEQDDSHFNDNSAFNYAALNQSGNLAALMAILGAA